MAASKVAPRGEPKTSEVELEDVTMVPDGKDTFRVVVAKVRGVVVAEKVLDERVSLPVARQACVTWRAKNGGLFRGIR